MNESRVRQLAVVQRSAPHRLIGIVSMSDIIRIQAQAAMESGATDKSVSPGFGDESEYLADRSENG
jgi:hypothetical protein